jgi:hypothetical protein
LDNIFRRDGYLSSDLLNVCDFYRGAVWFGFLGMSGNDSPLGNLLDEKLDIERHQINEELEMSCSSKQNIKLTSKCINQQ